MENEDNSAIDDEGNLLSPEDALLLEQLRQQLRSLSIGQTRPSSSQQMKPRSLDSLRLQRMRQPAQQPEQQPEQQPRKRLKPTLAARRPPSPPVPTAPPNSPTRESEEN